MNEDDIKIKKLSAAVNQLRQQNQDLEANLNSERVVKRQFRRQLTELQKELMKIREELNVQRL